MDECWCLLQDAVLVSSCFGVFVLFFLQELSSAKALTVGNGIQAKNTSSTSPCPKLQLSCSRLQGNERAAVSTSSSLLQSLLPSWSPPSLSLYVLRSALAGLTSRRQEFNGEGLPDLRHRAAGWDQMRHCWLPTQILILGFVQSKQDVQTSLWRRIKGGCALQDFRVGTSFMAIWTLSNCNIKGTVNTLYYLSSWINNF